MPPSGHTTVVWMFRVVNAGCCRNCVNGIGIPWLPPSNTGVMNVVTGNSGTVAPVWAARFTGRFNRTNRRSADTTAWMPMLEVRVRAGQRVCSVGMNTNCPFTEITCTSVTKNWLSWSPRGWPSGR